MKITILRLLVLLNICVLIYCIGETFVATARSTEIRNHFLKLGQGLTAQISDDSGNAEAIRALINQMVEYDASHVAALNRMTNAFFGSAVSLVIALFLTRRSDV